MTTVVDTELFDSSEYKIPLPQVDGKDATPEWRFTGSIVPNLSSEGQASIQENSNLGTLMRLVVMVSVDGKANSIRYGTDDEEIVKQAIVYKIHSVEPAED